MTADELSLAVDLAHLYADRSQPESRLAPAIPDTTSWPAGVTSVTAVGSDRGAASSFNGGGPVSDDRPVIVLRMVGSFAVPRSGPPSSSHVALGTHMTVVADAGDGHVLDFGLQADPTMPPLPGAVVIFER